MTTGSRIDLLSRPDRQPAADVTVEYQSRAFTVHDYYQKVRGEYYWSLPAVFTGNKVGRGRMEWLVK